jgi:hypothetical protein
MSFGKARFLVNARGRRTGVLLTMEECRHASGELDELEAFRLRGLVWVDVDRTHSYFVDDKAAALEVAPQPHPGRQIIADALEGRAKRYLTDEGGKRLGVILNHRDYETTCRALEDLEDIKAGQEFDAARLRGDPDTELVPIEEVFARLDRKRG